MTAAGHKTGDLARLHLSRRAPAASLTVLLVAFLLLNFLQPCCEALAEAIPHQHTDRHSTVALSDSQAHLHGHGGADDHVHCVSTDGIDTSLPDFLASTAFETDTKFLFAGLILPALYRLTSVSQPHPLVDHQRGPSRRVYLTTLRLRI